MPVSWDSLKKGCFNETDRPLIKRPHESTPDHVIRPDINRSPIVSDPIDQDSGKVFGNVVVLYMA